MSLYSICSNNSLTRLTLLFCVPVFVLVPVHAPVFAKVELRVRRTSTASLWTCTKGAHDFAVNVYRLTLGRIIFRSRTRSRSRTRLRESGYSCTENEYRSAVDVYEGCARLRGECLPPRDRSNYPSFMFTYTYSALRNRIFVYGERVPLRCGRVRRVRTTSR